MLFRSWIIRPRFTVTAMARTRHSPRIIQEHDPVSPVVRSTARLHGIPIVHVPGAPCGGFGNLDVVLVFADSGLDEVGACVDKFEIFGGTHDEVLVVLRAVWSTRDRELGGGEGRREGVMKNDEEKGREEVYKHNVCDR